MSRINAQLLSAKVRHFNHQESIPHMLNSFPVFTADDLPDGLAWASDELTLNVHSGTHMDAPWHYYHPTSEGQDQRP
jgi:kynurenine formamidase